MWAVVSHEPGEPVELVDVPRPGPGPGQVLIRVEAAAVKPVDLATTAGFLVDAGMMPSRQQTGLGWDVAGVVADTGDGVTSFRPGQRVIGLRDLIDVPLGTFAVWIRAHGGRLAELAALADAGLLGVRVADTYPLDKAAVAFDRLSRGGLRGRLVLIP